MYMQALNHLIVGSNNFDLLKGNYVIINVNSNFISKANMKLKFQHV